MRSEKLGERELSGQEDEKVSNGRPEVPEQNRRCLTVRPLQVVAPKAPGKWLDGHKPFETQKPFFVVVQLCLALIKRHGSLERWEPKYGEM